MPGIGHLPISAFVLHAAEPVVVDTGLSVADRHFVEGLGAVRDPADVRWIWLTHPDRDHTGGLHDLLEGRAPGEGRDTFLGVGILSIDCVHLLNPGQNLDVGDGSCARSARRCSTTRPPSASRRRRPASCSPRTAWGAPLPTAELAGSVDVRAVPAAELRAAQLLWVTVDSSWVHGVDRAAYERSPGASG